MPTKAVQQLHLWMTLTLIGLSDRISGARTGRDASSQDAPGQNDADRGDVPGWVMITVMTAIVVIALLTVFRTAVTDAVKNAFDSVTGAGKG